MKYLVFLAIILVALAKRHHQPDAVLKCLQGVCKDEFDTCDNSTGCLKQLNKCMKIQERDPLNYSAGYECLEKEKSALNAFLENALDCMENEIINIQNHQSYYESYLI